jgi:SET and MYND domain-containing protein
MQGDGSSSGGWMTDDDDGKAEERMADDEGPPALRSCGAEEGGMAVDSGAGEEGPLDPTYLQLYLLKFVCPVPSCFGTMAPVGPKMSLNECAVCGHTRSEEQFLRDLEGPIAE